MDNGSVNGEIDRLQSEFSGMNIHRIPKNKGFSGGFNAAMHWVFDRNVNFTLFLTNDTILTPHALECCLDTHIRTGADLIAPCVKYLRQPEKIDAIGGYFDPGTCTLQHYREPNLPALLNHSTDYIPGTAMGISKKAFKTIGGMDESFFMYWEDVDFCYRARKAGIKMARAYPAEIHHGIGRTCHKKSLYTTYYFQRNRMLFAKRYLKPSQWNQSVDIFSRDLKRIKARADELGDQKRLDYISKLKAILNSLL